MFATLYNQPDRELLVGLDGAYRMFAMVEHGFSMSTHGHWIDSQTLPFEYDTIPKQDTYALELHFNGNAMTINAKEHTHQAVITLEDQV